MKRLLIDVTRTLQSGQHTGIQRVVRRLWQALHGHGVQAGVEVSAVVFEGAAWRALAGLPAHRLEAGAAAALAGAAGVALTPQPGDVLLMADASWYLQPFAAVDAALQGGAVLAGFVHDVLPLQQPQWFREGLRDRFAAHLYALAARAAVLLTPSEVVRRALQAHLADLPLQPPALRCQPLGADFCPQALRAAPALPAWVGDGVAFALMVGTVEPRKNHPHVLQVFEQLWAQGCSARLVLVGAAGWSSPEFLQRLASHSQMGRQLHWLPDADDAVLYALYGRARVVLVASLDEGFGLPLAEAAFLGCPVLACDVPVLREVGGDWPVFLPAQDVAAWAAALQGMLLAAPARQLRPAGLLTWAGVAGALWRTLQGLPSGARACEIICSP